MAPTPLVRQAADLTAPTDLAPRDLERAPVSDRRAAAYYIETLEDTQGFFAMDAAGRLAVTAAGAAAGLCA